MKMMTMVIVASGKITEKPISSCKRGKGHECGHTNLLIVQEIHRWRPVLVGDRIKLVRPFDTLGRTALTASAHLAAGSRSRNSAISRTSLLKIWPLAWTSMDLFSSLRLSK